MAPRAGLIRSKIGRAGVSTDAGLVMADWFVALAGARGSLAVDELTSRGHNCYRPIYRERHVSRGRKSWREFFLLGEYVLVELRMKLSAASEVVRDWSHQFQDVSCTRGIRAVLAPAGLPSLVREHEVASLRASERRGYVPAPERLKKNQPVFIQRGAFVDSRALYQFSCDRYDYVTIEGLCARVVQIPRGSIVAV